MAKKDLFDKIVRPKGWGMDKTLEHATLGCPQICQYVVLGQAIIWKGFSLKMYINILVYNAYIWLLFIIYDRGS